MSNRVTDLIRTYMHTVYTCTRQLNSLNDTKLQKKYRDLGMLCVFALRIEYPF